MEKFDEIKTEHPNWSDEQIWTAVSLNMEADKVIDNTDEVDLDPYDPSLMEEIIKGAMAWLDSVLPIIYAKVRDFFGSLLANIGSWISKGLEYAFKYIEYYF